jgi:hypothetical protein
MVVTIKYDTGQRNGMKFAEGARIYVDKKHYKDYNGYQIENFIRDLKNFQDKGYELKVE